MIERQGDNLSENVGRVTVVYVADRKVVRVVDSRSGVVIREDETEPLNITGFREVARRYREMCRI